MFMLNEVPQINNASIWIIAYSRLIIQIYANQCFDVLFVSSVFVVQFLKSKITLFKTVFSPYSQTELCWCSRRKQCRAGTQTLPPTPW